MSQQRRSRNEIVDENATKLVHSLRAEPKFPEVRKIFGPIQIGTSFSHAVPDMRSMHVWGNIILKEVTRAAGLNHGDVGIVNFAYDNANPTMKDTERNVMPNYPGDHRLAVGEFPAILDANIPIAFQKLTRSINFKELKESTIRTFGLSSCELECRIDHIIELFRPLQRYNRDDARSPVPVILDIRERILQTLEVDHVKETSFSSFRDRMVDALYLLDHLYAKPFYKMPLGNFEDVGYLRGLSENGERSAVTIELNKDSIGGEMPVFSFFDRKTGKKNVMKGDEVYDAMRQGKVIPTVPTIILAFVTGPQIAHMGGQDWKRYAPAYIPIQAEWLGLPKENSDSLILGTEGYKPYAVAYRDRKKDIRLVSSHFSISYVTIGAEHLRGALRTDEYLEGEYGKIFSGRA
jgi:hypothetical protein